MRWVGAFLLLLPLGWHALASPQRRAEVAARWPHLALLGLLGVGMYNAMQYMALQTSTPLNVTLIAASAPLWMMLTGGLLFRVRPGPRDVLAALLSLAGVVMVLTRGQPLAISAVAAGAGRSADPGGDRLLVDLQLAAGAAAAIDARRRAPASGTGPSFCSCRWCSGWRGPRPRPAPRPPCCPTHESVRWGWPLALALVYLAIGPSLIAYRAWGVGVARAGPAMAALFSNLTPLFAALISGLVLGSWPEPYHLLAFGLIVAGIVCSAWKPAAR